MSSDDAKMLLHVALFDVQHLGSDCRKVSPIPESRVIHVDQLSRNVNENHLKEIFGMFSTSF